MILILYIDNYQNQHMKFYLNYLIDSILTFPKKGDSTTIRVSQRGISDKVLQNKYFFDDFSQDGG